MPWVEEHERGGTRVRRYFRWAPGARRDMSILVLLGLAIVGYSGTSATSTGGGTGKLPRLGSTAVYPVKFPGWDKKPAPRPKPTVSYPIQWER
ncbi:hypothetical protein AB0P36_34735 [Streptomyces flavidovirens]|uniref:hypothetical protein n=1 Tax=Streptomyces flavidovirens TaxID=67298 RepID=UPI003420A4D3